MNVRLASPALSASPEITLHHFPVVLGRGHEVAVRLEDRWLSRRHCELFVANGLLQIRDLHSKHGTFVNGERINEATLYPGDRLQIGLCDFTARYEPDSSLVAALVQGS